MNASLRVQHWKKPSGRSRGSRARYAWFSRWEKKRAAMSSASRITRTASTSTPISRPNEKAYSVTRSEEHTSELQSQSNLVCRLLLEKKKKKRISHNRSEIKNTQQ